MALNSSQSDGNETTLSSMRSPAGGAEMRSAFLGGSSDHLNLSPDGTISLNSGSLPTFSFDPPKALSQLRDTASWCSEKLIPLALEGNHQVLAHFDSALNLAKKTIDTVVPGAVSFGLGFLSVPGHAASLLNMAITGSTKAATALGVIATNSAVRVFTFGIPAWLEAFRQHAAVNAASEEIAASVKDPKELLASQYLAHLKEPEIREGLTRYYNTREELTELRKQPERNRDAIERAAGRLAYFETNFKDSLDFLTLKKILESGEDFCRQNSEFVQKLAQEGADRMIETVENYYKNDLGRFADEVQVSGHWSELAKNPEQKRAALEERIAERLHKAMTATTTDASIDRELKDITSDLIGSFGVYRRYLLATALTLARFLPIPEHHAEPTVTDNDSYNYFTEITTQGIKAQTALYTNAGYETVNLSAPVDTSGLFPAPSTPTTNGTEQLSNWKFFPSLSDYIEFFGGLGADATKKVLPSGGAHVPGFAWWATKELASLSLKAARWATGL